MYIRVILPLPLDGSFIYFVPSEMEKYILDGSLVLVEFGKNNKHYYGLVLCVVQDFPKNISIKKIKPIFSIKSSFPVVLQSQLYFWKWISNYYMCTLSAVFKNVFPSSFYVKKKQLCEYDIKSNTFCCDLDKLQQKVFLKILKNFQKKSICLLHKNFSLKEKEIYIHLIERNLKQNKQILFLVPEIVLTNQLFNYLKQFFGDKVTIYHSKTSSNKQVKIWNSLLNDINYPIIIGVHSAIFLPFKNLGLIIIDEEHDPSYKHQKINFCYNVRNAAIFLATIHNSKVILSSATPSIESFYNVQIGKYAYTKLNEWINETNIPITLVDVKELKRKKKMKTIFSPLLIKCIKQKLGNGDQILLFQNRRGFALHLFCKICDWIPKCHFCDISLGYHRISEQLICHYCGKSYSLPKECPVCGNFDLKSIGYGTEKVEEEIKMLFHNITVDRMDFDTTKKKKSLKKIISNFENGQTKILIGTQMISKSLTLNKVGLVGILDVDKLMNFPNFRAYERAYQLILQIIGKVSKNQIQSEVILQTFNPDHPLIKIILQQNYKKMYDMQIVERILFKYPPLVRLIYIFLYHKNEKLLYKLSDKYVSLLKETFGFDKVIGHDKPIVGKLKNFYIRKILLKIKINISSVFVRKLLEEIHMHILRISEFRNVIVRYDVDPL